jgi:monoamine oxidase
MWFSGVLSGDHHTSMGSLLLSQAFQIGIVGGGPGGLMAAYHIQKYTNRPVRLTVFEASGRLGGKVHTPRFDTSQTTYEAGAAELYEYSHIGEDPLKELVAELGLSTTRMEGSAVIVGQQPIANLDDLGRHLGPAAVSALLAFDGQARGRLTPRDFYCSGDPALDQPGLSGRPFQPFVDAIQDEKARHYVETLIHSDLATEPAKTTLEYGLHNYLMNDARYMRLYSIEGGNERLTRELAARTRAQFLLNHRVTDVGLDHSGRMRASAVHQGRAVQEAFDCLILALPQAALPRLTYRGELLAEAMRRHLAHYDHPAHYLRITALFSRPFWRGKFPDSYCMLDKFGGCCLYDESLRNPGCREGVLGWLIAGQAAEQMSEWDDERLVAAALGSLPEFLADTAGDFIEARVHRWVGAVNAMPGGWSTVSMNQRHQPEPKRHQNLFVVGDYLFDSTLNGVLDSAEHVACWIASSLNEQSNPRHDGFGSPLASRHSGSRRKVRGASGRVPASR